MYELRASLPDVTHRVAISRTIFGQSRGIFCYEFNYQDTLENIEYLFGVVFFLTKQKQPRKVQIRESNPHVFVYGRPRVDRPTTDVIQNH